MADRFDEIIKKTLSHEGGKVFDKNDYGGPTAYGISYKSHPKEFDVTIIDKKVVKVNAWPTKERAIEIYRNDYWKKPKISLIENDIIAAKVFDIGVNVGYGRAIKFLQRSLNEIVKNGLSVDGIIGNNTIKAINSAEPNRLLELFKKHAKLYYESLNQPRFIKGWLNRLNS